MSEKKSYDFDFRWKSENGEVIAEDTAIVAESALWVHVPEKFRELVANGSILASVGEVTATAKVEGDKGKKVEKSAIGSYVRLEANSPQAMAFMMDNVMIGKKDENGKSVPGVNTRFNYGYDLARRNEIRNPLLAKLEGPERAIERSIKSLLGIPGMTEERARAVVLAQMAEIAKGDTASEPAAQ